MKIHVSKPLFAWDCLEDDPTLKTIKQLLDTLHMLSQPHTRSPLPASGTDTEAVASDWL